MRQFTHTENHSKGKYKTSIKCTDHYYQSHTRLSATPKRTAAIRLQRASARQVKKVYTVMSHHVYTTQHQRHDFDEHLRCAEGVEYKCTR